MDAELGLVLTLYGGREEEANPQESRKAGFVCQETGRSYNRILTARLRPIQRRSTPRTEAAEYRFDWRKLIRVP
jgi:hypothetical protein